MAPCAVITDSDAERADFDPKLARPFRRTRF